MGKEDEVLSLFRELKNRNLKHVVVGGMAVVLYGVERATFDIDIAFPPAKRDLARLLDVFTQLGYSEVVDVKSENHIASLDEIEPETIIELESVKVKNGQSVDVLIVPEGTFDFIWEHRVEVEYRETMIPIPSIVDLIHLKEKSGRPVDMEDARALRHILRTKKRS